MSKKNKAEKKEAKISETIKQSEEVEEMTQEAIKETIEEGSDELTQSIRRTVHGESVVDPTSQVYDAPVPMTKKDKFLRFMDTFGDLVFLNIVFVVGCVPLITIGAAFTALYAVTLKMVKHEEGSVVKSFWKAYKANMKAATKVWAVILCLFAVMYVMYCFAAGMPQDQSTIMIIFIGLMMLLLAFILPLLFPLVARYENTTFNYIKNAIFISVSRIWLWFRCFISWMAPVLLMLSQPKVLAYGWYAWLFLLCSLLAYSNSMVIRKLFDELEEKEREAAKEKAPEKSIAKNAKSVKKSE